MRAEFEASLREASAEEAAGGSAEVFVPKGDSADAFVPKGD